jgi:hypothetical protein
MFEKFCQDKQIKGNYKDALYHHLMAKYSEYDQPASVIDQLKQEEYEAERLWLVAHAANANRWADALLNIIKE